MIYDIHEEQMKSDRIQISLSFFLEDGCVEKFKVIIFLQVFPLPTSGFDI